MLPNAAGSPPPIKALGGEISLPGALSERTGRLFLPARVILIEQNQAARHPVVTITVDAMAVWNSL